MKSFDPHPSLVPLTQSQLAAGIAAMPEATTPQPVGEASNDDSFFRAA